MYLTNSCRHLPSLPFCPKKGLARRSTSKSNHLNTKPFSCTTSNPRPSPTTKFAEPAYCDIYSAATGYRGRSGDVLHTSSVNPRDPGELPLPTSPLHAEFLPLRLRTSRRNPRPQSRAASNLRFVTLSPRAPFLANLATSFLAPQSCFHKTTKILPAISTRLPPNTEAAVRPKRLVGSGGGVSAFLRPRGLAASSKWARSRKRCSLSTGRLW